MINKDQIRRMLDIADIKTSARLMLLVVEIVELQADLKALESLVQMQYDSHAVDAAKNHVRQQPEYMEINRARKQTLRCYEIGTKFRPYKRVLKMLQEHMGRKNDMMPICPHCREKIDLEKLANGVWIRKAEK